MADKAVVEFVLDAVFFVISAISFLFSLLAMLHVVSWVESPGQRRCWILVVSVFPLIGALVYYFTKYQRFREVGKRRWLSMEPFGLRDFFGLSENEKLGGMAAHPVEPKRNFDY